MNDFTHRIANLSPAKRAILEQLLKNNTIVVDEPAIPQRDTLDLPPLSFAQYRLWLLSQLLPDSPLYNLPKAMYLSGGLNVETLQQTLNAIVIRHEALHTTFVPMEGDPVQVITQSPSVKLPVIDPKMIDPKRSTCADLWIKGLKVPSERLGKVRDIKTRCLLDTTTQRPFNLSEDSMLRTILLRLDRDEYVLILVMHHMTFDGWSTGIFFREFAALYQSFSMGKPSSLTDLPIQYADFADWQRQQLRGKVLEDLLDYWQLQLGGDVPALKLPYDRPRPPARTYRGARQCIMLPKNLTEELKTLSCCEGVTLFMTLLTAFKTLLHKYSEQQNISVCAPVAGRSCIVTESLIGCFNNLTVMRTEFSGDPSFRELLFRVRRVVSGAYTHQDFPFQNLADFPNLTRMPLSRAMFSLEKAPNLSLPGMEVSFLSVDKGTADFDLSLFMAEEAEELTSVFEYKTDLFKASTIVRMLSYFQTLLESIVANPNQHLSLLPLPERLASQNALSTRETVKYDLKKCYMAPRNTLEYKLKTIWEKVLDTKPIGTNDNFFELGGDSLLITRLFSQIEEVFDRELPLTTFFQKPTIEQLTNILRQEDETTA